jgi:hypothetical protein
VGITHLTPITKMMVHLPLSHLWMWIASTTLPPLGAATVLCAQGYLAGCDARGPGLADGRLDFAALHIAPMPMLDF